MDIKKSTKLPEGVGRKIIEALKKQETESTSQNNETLLSPDNNDLPMENNSTDGELAYQQELVYETEDSNELLYTDELVYETKETEEFSYKDDEEYSPEEPEVSLNDFDIDINENDFDLDNLPSNIEDLDYQIPETANSEELEDLNNEEDEIIPSFNFSKNMPELNEYDDAPLSIEDVPVVKEVSVMKKPPIEEKIEKIEYKYETEYNQRLPHAPLYDEKPQRPQQIYHHEPVYQEPVYHEPVYQEQAYQENDFDRYKSLDLSPDSNVNTLMQLISRLPAGVTRQTGAQIIRQTMEAMGISMNNVLAEARQLQEELNQSTRDNINTIEEYRNNIRTLEKEVQCYKKQSEDLQNLINLFISTDRSPKR